MDTTSIAISVFSSIYCKFDRDGGMKMTETDIKSSAPAAEKKSNFIKKYNEHREKKSEKFKWLNIAIMVIFPIFMIQ